MRRRHAGAPAERWAAMSAALGAFVHEADEAPLAKLRVSSEAEARALCATARARMRRA